MDGRLKTQWNLVTFVIHIFTTTVHINTKLKTHTYDVMSFNFNYFVIL
jgi:hypothetical protein